MDCGAWVLLLPSTQLALGTCFPSVYPNLVVIIIANLVIVTIIGTGDCASRVLWPLFTILF